eukprot:scaffold9873_cov133-Amphora_coffeaeformis.AAC.4
MQCNNNSYTTQPSTKKTVVHRGHACMHAAAVWGYWVRTMARKKRDDFTFFLNSKFLPSKPVFEGSAGVQMGSASKN